MGTTEGFPAGEITRILIEWRRGDADAVNRLFPIVYQELRALARRQLRRGIRAQTLDTTGLVHEAYLKLVDQTQAEIRDRQHFFALASTAMRHIIVDYARTKSAQKRGGGEAATTLDEGTVAIDARTVEIVAIDEALRKLEALDERLVKIVEMRFFAGLSEEEIAEALSLSERTIKREWQKARAFLKLELSPHS